MRRATASAMPPADAGTTILTGRDGQLDASCAVAGTAARTVATATAGKLANPKRMMWASPIQILLPRSVLEQRSPFRNVLGHHRGELVGRTCDRDEAGL